MKTIVLCVFGLISFAPFLYGAEQEIGNWTYYAMGAKGGACTLLNDRQIRIQGFSYNGLGGDPWFMAYTSDKHRDHQPAPCCNYRDKNVSVIIPDERGQCDEKPGEYKEQDIVLTLPPSLTWENVDFLGLYCYKNMFIYGYVKIPAAAAVKDLALDAFKGTEPPGFDKCVMQQDRILATEPMPIKCDISAPANTSMGYYP